ncbi:hypothetical protein AB0K12_45630 [Nonomuraea sp. NPDC049419]|uniref:hypothetical protein n=1 Tax=Nonomuraea sp. NPDC049419 TaxID=3155772 RepID=UPI0034192BFF
MRSVSRGIKTLFALAVGMMTFVVMTGTAHAASASVSRTGVNAYASWNWNGRSTIDGINFRVTDTACDDNDVYVRLRVYLTSRPDGVDTTKHYDSNGCNNGTVSSTGLPLRYTVDVTGIRVIGCVDDAGSDTCVRSGFLDNPNV